MEQQRNQHDPDNMAGGLRYHAAIESQWSRRTHRPRASGDNPGSRATLEPSGSVIGSPLASRSTRLERKAALSFEIFSSSSSAAALPRMLSGDQPRSSAAR